MSTLLRPPAHRTDRLVHCLLRLSTTPPTRFSGDLDGFPPKDGLLNITVPLSTYITVQPERFPRLMSVQLHGAAGCHDGLFIRR